MCKGFYAFLLVKKSFKFWLSNVFIFLWIELKLCNCVLFSAPFDPCLLSKVLSNSMFKSESRLSMVFVFLSSGSSEKHLGVIKLSFLPILTEVFVLVNSLFLSWASVYTLYRAFLLKTLIELICCGLLNFTFKPLFLCPVGLPLKELFKVCFRYERYLKLCFFPLLSKIYLSFY